MLTIPGYVVLDPSYGLPDFLARVPGYGLPDILVLDPTHVEGVGLLALIADPVGVLSLDTELVPAQQRADHHLYDL